jgi:hypothetical protein
LSNINCQFRFCKKNIFYDEKSSKPNGFVLILNACDDGNGTQEEINFEDITTQSCNTNDDVIYKLKKEALLVKFKSSLQTSLLRQEHQRY